MSDNVILTVKVPRSTIEQLTVLATRKGKTRSDIVREALRRYIMSELYGVQSSG